MGERNKASMLKERMDEAIKLLKPLEATIKRFGDEKVISSYYLEFVRRAYVLSLALTYCPKNSKVVDLGAQPLILSCALAKAGYKVTAVDIEPDKYKAILSEYNVEVVQSDLEKGLNLPDENFDCAVLTEVIEHINPYKVNIMLSEVNRVLKMGKALILTTPNIASLFRRIKLLIGKQPIYKHHVKEWTMEELLELLANNGFKVIFNNYVAVNDLSFVDCRPSEYEKLVNYANLLKLTVRSPTKLKLIRSIAYPIVKVIPSLI